MKCCDPTGKRQQALAQLGRAHRSGALAKVAGGELAHDGGLGGLEPGAWWPNPTLVDQETDAFDGRLNAWLADTSSLTNIPPALRQQIDDYIARWRDQVINAIWVFSGTKSNTVLKFQAEFNRLAAQVAAVAGHPSIISEAMASVDGVDVPADKIPPGSSTLDRVETIVKWGGLALGAVAAYKIADTLGLVGKLRGLVGGGGGGGGGYRRYGSAKL